MSKPNAPPVVVFLCVHNSCRSQMAEGMMTKLYGEQRVTVFSAGSEPGDMINLDAMTVLTEKGIDVSHHGPKHMDDIPVDCVDLVVTLCSNDGKQCPIFTDKTVIKHIHHEFDDPSRISRQGEDGLQEFRRVRDEIESFIRTLYPFLLLEEQHLSSSDEIVAASVSATLSSANVISSPVIADAKISFFEKYLSIWVLVCMVAGSVIGYFAPEAGTSLKKAEVYGTSIPIAVLLWVMIFPMLLQIDFVAFLSAIKNPGPIILTTSINFGIQPFLMYAVALIFFRYIYASIIPSDLAREYLAGCILLGGAPCAAMVFVWSLLVGGNAGYTLMQVAVNDVLVLVLYLPTMLLLLNASSIPIPYELIAVSVALFIVAPLMMSVTVRHFALRNGGEENLNRIIDWFKPVTTVGLLATLILIFIYQGRTIGDKPLHIVLIAVPLTIQTFAIFFLTYWLGYMACMEPDVLAPASLISTSNFFELAVAIAISVYGADSGASLATVVGVLVEVPTMLVLVQVCKHLRPYAERRNRDCDEKCKALRDFGSCHMCKKAVVVEETSGVQQQQQSSSCGEAESCV